MTDPPPEQNGQRTTHDWLQIIHQENETAHRALAEKLDTKADKDDLQRVGERVTRVEDKTNNLTVKVGSIAALMTGVGVWAKSQFLG